MMMILDDITSDESESGDNDDSDEDESMESEEEVIEIPIGERLESNDPTLMYLQICHQQLDDIMEALERNTVVVSIAVCVLQNETGNNTVDFTRLYNHIKVRRKIHKLWFRDLTLRHDISHFLEAASENPTLHSLDIRASTTFATESLAKLQGHPNLTKLCFSSMGSEPIRSVRMFQRIIETCPKLKQIKIFGGKFSTENWIPIQEALYKVQREMDLNLQCCYFDEDATELLQSFLKDSSNRVRLRVHVTSVRFHEMDESWLYQLVGPAVHALKLNYGQIADDFGMDQPNIAQFMNSLKHNQNNQSLKILEFKKMNSERDYRAIVDSIPYLSCLEEIKIGVFPVEFVMETDTWHFKKQLLLLLSKNISITKVELNICGFDGEVFAVYWSDADKETLQSLQQRNKNIPGLIMSPDSIPLGAWPHVFQTLQTATVGASLIYQGLRGLTTSLPVCSNSNDI